MAKKLIGDPIDRIDGDLKVTGRARYSADMKRPDMVYGVLVMSSIGNGRIRSFDTAETLKMPGVLTVMSYGNAPKVAGINKNKPSEVATDRVMSLFQDNKVHYNNQPIAMVIADTFEHAVDGAARVKVTYESQKPKPPLPAGRNNTFTPERLPRYDDQVDTKRGNLKAGLSGASTKVTETYTTPTQTHNALEPHALIAYWEGEKLTMYNATQGVSGVQKRISELFGMPKENVRVIAQFVGGGFGSKGATWSHVMLAPMAAKLVGKPVKLVLMREHMFGMVGWRSSTVQKMVVGTKKDGEFTALSHDTISQTSAFDEFAEPAGTISRMMYASPNMESTHRLIRANIGTPSAMRAPGEAPGVFALESVVDEVAYAINMDPIALRLKNYAETDPHKNLPFSSKSLRECYQQGAERFGWAKRTPEPRSMREGNELIGMGMASSIYPVNRAESTALVRIKPDGKVQVETGTQDIGTGTYTVMTQVAADVLGLSPDDVTLSAGDTRFPESTTSGGSRTTASTGSAVTQAAQAVLKQAKQLAYKDKRSPLFNVAEAEIVAENGRLQTKSDPRQGETFVSLLKRNGSKPLEAKMLSKSADEKDNYSLNAFGSIFAEVRIDEALGRIRVSRMIGTFAAGRILNAKTARSQILGGMIWGVSMALLEDTLIDPRTGRVMNPNLAEYHVPVNADIEEIDGFFIEEKDETVNPAGVKGIGEIGVVGSVSAIANAVYHATGKRIRDLPITLEKVLDYR
ncbi:xanthine dehydrogenase family protein molybdopterin-binding subunit [Spirosoma utsteinense]|uniref:Xanthine dehydrogenase YagR molybdenum-binding subunit n=1 Tax=Spirosoma utsteinense TaxID=2585773 RepID=A0ABR6W6K9_9BACT|nr:xanthine dehydrogenase family protein molybdopterin-binding subunit [Spirosoma utsteinense]MBC3787890.1 xanthine dehydrogenase YagR molybdenum-binding subunit [Spirosoma utsteinense]MBC3792189.1 xanthine dehydrogenase YagR molybdenum-binding subunit [Spirosoma utsteinense]